MVEMEPKEYECTLVLVIKYVYKFNTGYFKVIRLLWYNNKI